MMKNLILAAMVLFSTITFAQKDKVTTSKVKKTTVVKNGEVINTKTKVITTKAQQVKFANDQRYQLNQDRVPAPIAVTKVFMIDNDSDPEYDQTTTVKYYDVNNKRYGFKMNNNAMDISYVENDKEINVGRAVQSKYNDYYIINSREMQGVGYFTKDNDFVMEYYDPATQDTKTVIFTDLKF